MVSLLQRPTETRAGRSLLRGLQAVWPLQFPDGGVVDLKDYRGGATLTDNFTVTTVAGPSAKLARATQFTAANSEYLSVTGTAALRGESGTWSRSFFMYPDTVNTAQTIFASGDTTDGIRLRGDGDGRFRLIVGKGGTTTSLYLGGGIGTVLSAAAWYWIYVELIAGATMGIAYNTTPLITTALGGTFAPGAGNFNLGATLTPDTYFNGRLAQFIVASRGYTRQERTYLYNGGQGRGFRRNRGFY